MKNLTLSILILCVSSLAFGSTFKGKIINLVEDEEGTKVILQHSKKIVSLYSSNASHNHDECLTRLEAAKKSGAIVQIQTKDKALAEILHIKVLK